VEHGCQQCGTTVEDGRAFCPQCRAPQIHVEIAVPDVVRPNPLQEEASAEMLLAPPSTAQTPLTGTPNRTIASRVALKAGVLGFFLGMFLPFLAIVIAGALAIYFYRRESGVVLPPALGSRLGAAAGVVAVAIQSVFFAIWIFAFHRQKEYIDSVTRFVRAIGGDASIPDIQASVRSLFTPAGLLITLFFVVIVAMMLAALGGMLASFFLRPRRTRP
jgi:hypothetical protein